MNNKKKLLIKHQLNPIFIAEIAFEELKISFRKYEEFGDEIEIDNSNVGDKKTKIYEQNPLCNG